MKTLWQSPDGYVVVVDDVAFPDPNEDEGPEASELAALFQAGAWIVVWRSAERPDRNEWRFTRNRRYGKPSLGALRRVMRAAGREEAGLVWIASNDAHGHLFDEWDALGAPVRWGELLYAAWEVLAADALPAKVAFLGLDADEPAVEKVPAWMRPGLAEYARRRRAMRELMEEIAA